MGLKPLPPRLETLLGTLELRGHGRTRWWEWGYRRLPVKGVSQRTLNLESRFCMPVLSDTLYFCDLGRILVPTVDLCEMRGFV